MALAHPPDMANTVLGGSVEPGYEPVRDVFVQHFADGIEDCAQCCIYVKGEKVVDMWGARTTGDGTPVHNYGPGSMQNIFSSSKVLTSLVVSMLADRGHLSYTQLVTDLWPEFARHGKASTTVGHVMRHEAGLPDFDRSLNLADLTAEQVRKGAVSDIIADQKPKHKPGQKRMYHGLTRGWIVNEIVRRADPAGRTIGQFLHDEVAVPFGLEAELNIGLPDALHGSVAPLTARPVKWTVSQLIRPRAFGGGRLAGMDSIGIRMAFLTAIPLMEISKLVRKSEGPLVVSGENQPKDFALWNTPELRRAEVPSANGHASARALAILAAAIVEGGALPGGPRLLSPEGVAAAHGDPVMKTMLVIMKTRFTNAGWNIFEKDRMGFVGWMGLGGSVMQWHHEQRIGFGYAMNCIETAPWNARASNLQKAALRCAKRRNISDLSNTKLPSIPLKSRL